MDADLSAFEILAGAGVVHVCPSRLGRAAGHMPMRVRAAVHAAPASRVRLHDEGSVNQLKKAPVNNAPAHRGYSRIMTRTAPRVVLGS